MLPSPSLFRYALVRAALKKFKLRLHVGSQDKYCIDQKFIWVFYTILWKNPSKFFDQASISRTDLYFLFLDASCEQVHQRCFWGGFGRPGEILRVLSLQRVKQSLREGGVQVPWGPGGQGGPGAGLWMSVPGGVCGERSGPPRLLCKLLVRDTQALASPSGFSSGVLASPKAPFIISHIVQAHWRLLYRQTLCHCSSASLRSSCTGDLGPDTFISGVCVLTATPGDFLHLPKFENTRPVCGLGKPPEIAVGESPPRPRIPGNEGSQPPLHPQRSFLSVITHKERLSQDRASRFCFCFLTYINCKSFHIRQNENKG